MRVSTSARTPLFVLLLTAAAAASAGCSGSTGAVVEAPPPSNLPLWDGHAREVFDDNIDPAAVGLTMEGASARTDAFLRERAQTAELVARVRVQTVTVDSIGEQSTYHLAVEVAVPPLAETKSPTNIQERRLELAIRPQSMAFGIAKAFDARLRGAQFIGFFQRFASSDGETELHWHLSPDTAEVAAAVKDAVALRELSGS